jgi:hypothetical protein
MKMEIATFAEVLTLATFGGLGPLVMLAFLVICVSSGILGYLFCTRI